MRWLAMLLLVSRLGASELPKIQVEKIVNAIYILEGGPNTRFPYGIKSIDTGGNREKARQICIKTVQNNWRRWEAAGRPNKYIDFLADRYCPKSVDKKGNANWRMNVRRISGLDF